VFGVDDCEEGRRRAGWPCHLGAPRSRKDVIRVSKFRGTNGGRQCCCCRAVGHGGIRERGHHCPCCQGVGKNEEGSEGTNHDYGNMEGRTFR
jgi:hypothetical protein